MPEKTPGARGVPQESSKVIRPEPVILPMTSVAPPATAILPLTVTLPPLSPTNDAMISRFTRRLREVVMDGQKHRADGAVVLKLIFSGGQLATTIHVQPAWSEKV